jgi:hypothetical protein
MATLFYLTFSLTYLNLKIGYANIKLSYQPNTNICVHLLLSIYTSISEEFYAYPIMIFVTMN